MTTAVGQTTALSTSSLGCAPQHKRRTAKKHRKKPSQEDVELAVGSKVVKGSKHKSNTTLSNYLRAKSSFNSSYAGGRKSLNATVMLGQQPERGFEAGHRNAYRTSGGSSKSGLAPSSFVATFKDLQGKLNPYRQPQAREL